MAQVDREIVLWLNSGVGNIAALDRLAEWLVSDYLVTAVLGLSLVAIWFGSTEKATRIERQIGVLTALGALAVANLVVITINSLYFRDRPFADLDVTLLFYRPTDSSMPSNSAAAFVGLAAVVWGFDRRVGAVLLAVAGLHAFLRVYAGVHYPSDIAVGVVIGIAAALGAYGVRLLLGPIPGIAIRAARVLCVA